MRLRFASLRFFMKEENVVLEKSYRFAVRIVRLYQHVSDEKKEYVLSKQVLRSGTSVGANVEEAVGDRSRKDFTAKMGIAYHEARETRYWLRLLRDTDYLTPREAESILKDVEELLKLIASILITTRNGSDDTTDDTATK